MFELVLALQKLFQSNHHRRKAKNRIFTKSTDTVTVLICKIALTQCIGAILTENFKENIIMMGKQLHE